MPRGRIKEVLHTARIDVSPGRRTCRGDTKNHVIVRQTQFLAIKDGLGEKSYCLECARAILERGQERLRKLFADLEQAEQG